MSLRMRTLVRNSRKIALAIMAVAGLSACVTQNYAEEKPVTKRDYSDDQLARTRISLALGYLDMGNTGQAKYNLEKAKQFSPDLVEVYTAFAHYYESVGEYEQTEEAYIEALSIEDEDADTLNNFGVFLCRRDRVEEAEKYFLQAIKVPTYTRVSESYENIALCYLKVEKFDQAEKALKRSIAHSPNSASSLIQMAQVQYAKGEYEQGSNYISRFELATRKFTPQAIALAFKIHNKLGNTEVASNYATMLLKMFPDSSQSRAYLDNELAHITADDLAIKYQNYKLIKSGVKINYKPVVKLAKANKTDKIDDGLNRQPPKITINDTKLVDDVTIAKQTGKSIASNSIIDNQTKSVKSTTKAQSTGASSTAVAQQPSASKPITAATTKVTTAQHAKPAPAKSVVGSAPIKNLPATTVAQQPAPVNPSVTVAQIDGPAHVVTKGDNLYQLSIKYNITIRTLRRWNDLTDENIHVGQVLRLSKPD